MTKIKLKIYGLGRVDDMLYVNELQPHYIGFVFAPSKRQITYEEAKELKQLLNKEIKVVGVFVNESVDLIIHYLNENLIDCAQLHGNETNEIIKNIKLATGKEVWKAVKVQNQEDITSAIKYDADKILFDSGSGSGESFSWQLLKGYTYDYFLAGGIGSHNIDKIIKNIKPCGIDLSSMVETDGWKDYYKMNSMIEKTRGVKE